MEWAVLGVLQGIVEWLPLSSEGVVTVAGSFLLDRPFSEAVAFALWLHLGTALSAIVVFRHEISGLLRELPAVFRERSSLLTYVLLSTAVSAVIGLPVLVLLGSVPDSFGAVGMALVGTLMLITGGVQVRRPSGGHRDSDQVSGVDALVVGVAQGMAASPGLSRSGLTVAVLLARRMDRRAALTLSFIISIPASIGAALYAAVSEEAVLSLGGVVAGLVAFIIGLLTIKGLMALAQRINFGVFVIGAGVAMLLGALLLQA